MSIEGGVLEMPVVWDTDCLLHRPAREVWLGDLTLDSWKNRLPTAPPR